MKINGFHCPKCGKEFDICRPLGNKLMCVCVSCDVLCVLESYSNWQQKARIVHLKMKTQIGYVPYSTTQKDLLEQMSEKPEEEEGFNPSKRDRHEKRSF